MPSYLLEIDGIGPIKVEKKRGMKSIRIRINSDGSPVVSAPWHIPKPYITGFIIQKREWILNNTDSNPTHYLDGSIVCGDILLRISDGYTKNYTKYSNSQIYIKIAGSYAPNNANQKKYIDKKILEALKHKAENILLPRLFEISTIANISFNQGYVKRLSSRWGSCDRQKNIILNIYLMQVPEHLRDYVLVHELTHTIYLNHSKEFWEQVESLLPDYKILRKQLKQYKTRISVSND